MRIHLLLLPYVPDRFKTQKMRHAAVREDPCELEFVPNHFKAQEMCNEEVPICPYLHTYCSMSQGILRCRRCVIRQWEMTLPLCNMFLIGLLQGREHICGMMTIMMIMVIVGLLGDDNDDKFIKWYNDYKKWKS